MLVLHGQAGYVTSEYRVSWVFACEGPEWVALRAHGLVQRFGLGAAAFILKPQKRVIVYAVSSNFLHQLFVEESAPPFPYELFPNCTEDHRSTVGLKLRFTANGCHSDQPTAQLKALFIHPRRLGTLPSPE